MINVQFRSYGPGTCSWCRKQRSEVFTVAFGDQSFSGPMCWNDLRCAIRFKVAGDDLRTADGAAAPAPEDK
jgi:hypothetical protein